MVQMIVVGIWDLLVMWASSRPVGLSFVRNGWLIAKRKRDRFVGLYRNIHFSFIYSLVLIDLYSYCIVLKQKGSILI